MAKKQVTINPGVKSGMFFTKKDFNLEVKMGRSYLETDIPASVFLYRIDRNKTKVHALYGEAYASEKVTLPKIELIVKFNIEESESGYIGDSQVSTQWNSDLIFTIYEDELKEKKCEIHKGDYIGKIGSHNKMIYYEIFDNDMNNSSNVRTIGGIESFYRKIRCKQVQSDVFNPSN